MWPTVRTARRSWLPSRWKTTLRPRGFVSSTANREPWSSWPITIFEQSLSGYPTFGFAVGALTYVMAISSIPSEGGLLEAPGPVTVTGGGGASVSFMLRLPTPSTVTDFAFTCLEP